MNFLSLRSLNSRFMSLSRAAVYSLMVLALSAGPVEADCGDIPTVWLRLTNAYPELDLRGLMEEWTGSPDVEVESEHLQCVENGVELEMALRDPSCASVIVLQEGDYDRVSHEPFSLWEKGSGASRGWRSGTCAEREPLILIGQEPIVEAPDLSKRGPGPVTGRASLDSEPGLDFGAILRTPFALRADGGGRFYSSIWVVGLGFYGDETGEAGTSGFWMNDDHPTGCGKCFVYRNVFRRIYGRKGAVRLAHADGTAIFGNRFVEVGHPGDSRDTHGSYPVALFDSVNVRIGWNLFDGIPLEGSDGEVDEATDTWQGLESGELGWMLRGAVSGVEPRNVLYATHSARSPENERTGACGLDYFRNVIVHSGGMDIKNALCDPQDADRDVIRVYDNSFVNSKGVTLHAGDTWVRIDGNDFVGTNGVRITNSKAGARGGSRRADYYGYLHDLYVTENLFACGGRGVLIRGGKRYVDWQVEHDKSRDLYNLVVAANWMLFNDREPFDIGEDETHAGVWIRGLLGDGVLEVSRFGEPEPESRHVEVDDALFLCGNLIAANGGREDGPDDPEHYASCDEFADDQRFQIHSTRDEDAERGLWGWNAASDGVGLYDANSVVTSLGEFGAGRFHPMAVPGENRRDAFTDDLAAADSALAEYEASWRAFCHVGAAALYDGPWGRDYGRIGERALDEDRLVAPPPPGSSWWSGGATLEHSSKVGGCPSTRGTEERPWLDTARLRVDRGHCPSDYEAEVRPDWTFAAEDLEPRPELLWREFFAAD